jgi:hypothetical protein
MPSILRQLVAAAKNRMFAPERFSGSNFGYQIGKAIFKIVLRRTADGGNCDR